MDKTIRIAPGNLSEITIHNIIVQNDINAYYLNIFLPQEIEGEVRLRFAKPDKTWHDSAANREGNKIVYKMEPRDYDQLGLLKCYVRVFSEFGGVYTPLLIRFTGVRGGTYNNE